ncbi:malto-oligosyltrehalose synthase [Methylocella silvestris BL2]|uniref:Malto-oligosyltrehalose synthase n=1 Tax=Methylocella silvestris (strain DSM 15510 / CIP 108128 / LMG 27833 / NCIMB 13906 / BL2) TaxID=395965 RepID=B8ES66_METSB|nr:malto-oligosyltrehalose synthase [Methylocella silvestris]ACK52281.1 malto-oligosyltrehalose synthase [Methylocella silvestris BL2]
MDQIPRDDRCELRRQSRPGNRRKKKRLGADNPLWLDVLEWGPDADHAGWFDIDWDSENRYLKDKLLAPFLGGQYGVELKAGKLQVKFDPDEGSFAVWAYGAHKLPLCPLHYQLVLGRDDAELDRLGDMFGDLRQWRPEIRERTLALKAKLAALARERPEARLILDQTVAALNADWRALDALIQRQFWRIAYFGVAGDDINYRRFFNINDLAGLRIELPVVFRHAHARVLPMIEEGVIDGLRIDHIDGLLDPKAYLDRLRASVERPFYLVVEKILAPYEALRDDWQVDGTTGYDFANLVLGILINPAGEAGFTQTYKSFAGVDAPFSKIAYASKIRIMENEMSSELNTLGQDAARIARQNPETVDFTKPILQRAIKQIVACFPVYRTYVDFNSASDEADRRYLDWAVAQARRLDHALDPSVFNFLGAALSGELTRELNSGFSRAAVARFAMKLQQYSGPVMAKGLEDTAFYRYNRFVALNEVGGDPQRFGVTPAAFHKANAERARKWPRAMLATATHDTKRGEDARARLAALSDAPDEWTRQVQIWSRLLRARRGDVEGDAPPDRNDEYLLYQLLAGSWPTELLEAPNASALESYALRVAAALTKSLREAKTHSSWTAPNADYEQAMQSFASSALDAGNAAFLTSFLPFIRRLARLGVDNSLAQTTLKLTAPGIPDIYQGCETWDLSLVDPDNRRPVNFEAGQQALRAIRPMLAKQPEATMRGLLDQWQDGHIKLAVTAALLDLRKQNQTLFENGSYEALSIHGEKSDFAVGFVRAAGDVAVAVLTARFPGRRAAEPNWDDAAALLPEGEWADIFTACHFTGGGSVALAELFAVLPVAVLVNRSPPLAL